MHLELVTQCIRTELIAIHCIAAIASAAPFGIEQKWVTVCMRECKSCKRANFSSHFYVFAFRFACESYEFLDVLVISLAERCFAHSLFQYPEYRLLMAARISFGWVIIPSGRLFGVCFS